MNQNMNTNYTFFSKIIIFIVALFSMNGAQAQNGSLDLTFDSDGKVTTHAASKEAEAQSILLQKDGKIIVAGSFTSLNFVPVNDIARLNADGSIAARTSGEQTQKIILDNFKIIS